MTIASVCTRIVTRARYAAKLANRCFAFENGQPKFVFGHAVPGSNRSQAAPVVPAFVAPAIVALMIERGLDRGDIARCERNLGLCFVEGEAEGALARCGKRACSVQITSGGQIMTGPCERPRTHGKHVGAIVRVVEPFEHGESLSRQSRRAADVSGVIGQLRAGEPERGLHSLIGLIDEGGIGGIERLMRCSPAGARQLHARELQVELGQ